MTKRNKSTPKQAFWVLLVVAILIVSLLYWFLYASTPQAAENTPATAVIPACSVNMVIALDTSNDMGTKLGEGTRTTAAVVAANELLDHITKVNTNNPTGIKSKVGLRTFPNNVEQVALTDDLASVRSKLTVIKNAGPSNGNTVTAALKDAHKIVAPAGDPATRGTTFIVLISSVKNSEADVDDTRTAVKAANEIKAKNIIIEAFGFGSTAFSVESLVRGETQDTEEIVSRLASGDARYHRITSSETAKSLMNTFAETTCPQSAFPPIAACSPNLDVAYLVEDSNAFQENNNRVKMTEDFATKAEAKMHVGNDRAAALAFSYSAPTEEKVVKQGFDADLSKATLAVKALKYNDGKSVDQGVNQASAYIRQNQTLENGRIRPTAVLLVTFSDSNVSSTAVEKAQEDFSRYGIRYFPVQIGPENNNHFAILQQIANASGGQAFDLRNSGTDAERVTRIQQTVDTIFTALDTNVVNCVDVELSLESDNIKEGETTEATFLVTNNSRVSITGANVVQPLPVGLVFGPHTLEIIGTLASGASVTKTLPLIAQ